MEIIRIIILYITLRTKVFSVYSSDELRPFEISSTF